MNSMITRIYCFLHRCDFDLFMLVIELLNSRLFSNAITVVIFQLLSFKFTYSLSTSLAGCSGFTSHPYPYDSEPLVLFDAKSRASEESQLLWTRVTS